MTDHPNPDLPAPASAADDAGGEPTGVHAPEEIVVDVDVTAFLAEGVELAKTSIDPSEPEESVDAAELADPAEPEVDTEVLSRIEDDFADVDAALAAIDAGDLDRSPLLERLLAAPQPSPSDSGSASEASGSTLGSVSPDLANR